MFFVFILIGMAFVVLLFIFQYLIPTLKRKYKLQKQLKAVEKRRLAFKRKMEELEIK